MNLKFTQKKRSKMRGAATAEALIMLIFFTLAWTGVKYMGQLSAIRLRARAEVRACAFYIATHSCQDTPDQCIASSQSDGPSDQEKEDIKELTQKGNEAKHNDFTETVMDMMDNALGLDLFARAEAQVAGSIDRPPLLGGETIDLGQSMTLPCNPVDKSLTDVLMDILGGLVGIGGG